MPVFLFNSMWQDHPVYSFAGQRQRERETFAQAKEVGPAARLLVRLLLRILGAGIIYLSGLLRPTPSRPPPRFPDVGKQMPGVVVPPCSASFAPPPPPPLRDILAFLCTHTYFFHFMSLAYTSTPLPPSSFSLPRHFVFIQAWICNATAAGCTGQGKNRGGGQDTPPPPSSTQLRVLPTSVIKVLLLLQLLFLLLHYS